jgi:integrase
MPAPKLLDQVRDRIRVKHYSLRTEDAYLHWIRRFIFSHGKRHPRDMGGPEVEVFLSHLATAGRVAPSTQNQALSALLFLYREVLEVELPWLDGVVRAKRPRHIPVVLTENEVRTLLAQLDGTKWLVACLLYSSGMRVLEGLRLRVKDVDFERGKSPCQSGWSSRCARTSHGCATCTGGISPRASARFTCPSRSRASTRKPDAAGPGNTCFPPAAAPKIRWTE